MSIKTGLYRAKTWLYRGGRPNALARLINRGWGAVSSLGVSPNRLVTLEVVGRSTGKTVSFPLVMAVVNDRRYLVSMLGPNPSWVRNLAAAHGEAALRHGDRELVRLVEVDVARRAPILKAYLQIAPGARPHISVGYDAPVVAFESIARDYPVFEVVSRS